MNQLLSENESKISVKEKIVKEKRLVNDRLEQLRFVLEYQIKNLILEKTPIEEQIKNFAQKEKIKIKKEKIDKKEEAKKELMNALAKLNEEDDESE